MQFASVQAGFADEKRGTSTKGNRAFFTTLRPLEWKIVGGVVSRECRTPLRYHPEGSGIPPPTLAPKVMTHGYGGARAWWFIVRSCTTGRLIKGSRRQQQKNDYLSHVWQGSLAAGRSVRVGTISAQV